MAGGIEMMRLESIFLSDTDEEHGANAIKFKYVKNSWVQRVTSVHFSRSAVRLEKSNFNTVQDVAFVDPKSKITGGRRYSFMVSSGIGNLFQRCYSEFSRHDFVLGSRVTGPNVWLDCYAHRSYSDSGPHHRWATGILFDNVISKALAVENRKNSGTGHGWSGSQILFWNSIASKSIKVLSPTGAMSWGIGLFGRKRQGTWTNKEAHGWWESHYQRVDPRSLYLAQLKDRLGMNAVLAITTPAQRQGRIWGQLAAWAGNGRLEDFSAPGDPHCLNGILSGHACLEKRCAEENCNPHEVLDSGRSCQVYPAPCIK